MALIYGEVFFQNFASRLRILLSGKQARSDSNAYLAVLETAVLPIKLPTNNRPSAVSTYVFRAVRGTMEFSLSAR